MGTAAGAVLGRQPVANTGSVMVDGDASASDVTGGRAPDLGRDRGVDNSDVDFDVDFASARLVPALQYASTRCAVLGSLAVVADTWAKGFSASSDHDPDLDATVGSTLRPSDAVGSATGSTVSAAAAVASGRGPWPVMENVLPLAAAGLILVSLTLEVAALFGRRRGRRRRGSDQEALAPLGTAHGTGGGTRMTLFTSLRSQLLPLLGPALVMGAFTALGGAGAARSLGIVPRTWGGLRGVVFGCFVHLSWSHFGWNAIAFVLLGLCVIRVISSDAAGAARGSGSGWRRETDGAGHGAAACSGAVHFAAASAFIAVTSGFCVWCLARPAVHAGASGVVCGYAGLLIAVMLRRRDVPFGPLLMVLGVAACYGGAALLAITPGGVPPSLASRGAGPDQSFCAWGDCGMPRGDSGPGHGVFGLTDTAYNGRRHGRLLLYEACTSRTTSAEHHTFGFLSGLACALFFCRPPGPPEEQQPCRGGGMVVDDAGSAAETQSVAHAVVAAEIADRDA